jgi:TP901 family phage tail tape measure protein
MATSQELEFILRMRDEASRVLSQFGAGATQTGGQLDGLTSRFDELTRAARNFTAVIAGGMAVKGLTTQTLGTFREYQNQMTMVAKTTDQNKQQMGDFSKALDKTALSLKGIQVSELQQFAQVAGQLGITGSDNILKFSAAMAKLQRSSNVQGAEGATQLARTMGLTNTPIDQVEKFSGVLVELGRTMKANEEEILNMGIRVAQTTANFKLGYQNVLAISAEASDLGFKPELFSSVMGRALGQIQSAAVNNTKAMRQFSKVTGMTSDQMSALIKNNPSEAFLKWLDVLNQVDAAGGSTIQFLQDWNLYAQENAQVLDVAAKHAQDFRDTIVKAFRESEIAADKNALNQMYAKTFDNLDTAVLDLNDAWTIFTKNIGAALAPGAIAGLNLLTDGVLGLTHAFAAMPETAQQIVAWGALIGTATIPAVAGFRLLGTAIRFVLPGIDALAGSSLVGAIAKFLRISNLTSLWMRGTNALGIVLDNFGGYVTVAYRSLATFSAGLTDVELAAKALSTAVEGIGAAAEGSLYALTALAVYKGLDAVPHAGYQSAQQKNPNLLIDMANQRKMESQYPGGVEGGFGRIGGYGDLAPKPNAGQSLDLMRQQNELLKKNTEALNKNEDAKMAMLLRQIKPSANFPKQLAPEYDNALQKLDKFRDAQNEVIQQTYALEALTKLSHDPTNSSELGGPNKATDETLARYGKLLEVAKRMADPTQQMIYDLGVEQKQVTAITVADQNRLEIENQLRKLLEDKGIVIENEKKRITDILQETQRLKSVTEAAKEGYSLDKELEQARARNSLNQQAVTIEQKINDFIRDRANLNQTQIDQMRQQLTLIANTQALNAIQDRAMPALAGLRQYLDDMARLKQALASNVITQQEYNAEVANLQKMNLQTRDPLGSRVRDMQQEVDLLQYQGREQEIQRQKMQEINALRDQGVQLDEKGKQLIEDYVRALQTAKEAQSTGFQAWANQLGTMQQQIGNLQQSIANSLSDGITDGLMSGDWGSALQSIASQIERAVIQSVVNSFMQKIIQGMSNPATDAAKNAQTAVNGLNNVAQASLTAATAVINAQVVTVNGAVPGIPGANTPAGVPALNNGVTPNNLPMGTNPRVPSLYNSASALNTAAAPTGLTATQQQVWSYWADKGLTPVQISGIMGNIKAESNFNPGIAGDNGNALGLAQWNDRGPAMKSFVGPDWRTNTQGQMDFMNHEFQTTESGAYQRLLAAKTPAEANAAMISYERPNGYTPGDVTGASQYQNRMNYTNQFYNQSQKAGIDPQTTSSIKSLNTQLQETATKSQTLTSKLSSQATQTNTAGQNIQQLNTKMQSTTPAVNNFGQNVGQLQAPLQTAQQGTVSFSQGLQNMFNGVGGTGGIVSLFAGLFHEGGMVGGGAPASGFALMASSGWANAPKFHKGGGRGLNQDEYRALLKQNERVLTEEDDRRTMNVLKAKAGGGGGEETNIYSPVTHININANGSMSKDEQEQLGATVDKHVRQALDSHAADFIRKQSRNGGMIRQQGRWT